MQDAMAQLFAGENVVRPRDLAPVAFYTNDVVEGPEIVVMQSLVAWLQFAFDRRRLA